MLQCLLATESLSTYFRNLAWKNEVNDENPLGMGGKVAEAYAGLNEDVSWAPALLSSWVGCNMFELFLKAPAASIWEVRLAAPGGEVGREADWLIAEGTY